jgi:hypothetical protein
MDDETGSIKGICGRVHFMAVRRRVGGDTKNVRGTWRETQCRVMPVLCCRSNAEEVGRRFSSNNVSWTADIGLDEIFDYALFAVAVLVLASVRRWRRYQQQQQPNMCLTRRHSSSSAQNRFDRLDHVLMAVRLLTRPLARAILPSTSPDHSDLSMTGRAQAQWILRRSLALLPMFAVGLAQNIGLTVDSGNSSATTKTRQTHNYRVDEIKISTSQGHNGSRCKSTCCVRLRRMVAS